MGMKKVLAAAGAISLMAAPVAASAQAASAPTPGAEQVEGSELRRRGFILPLLVVVAIIAAILLLTGGGEEGPESP